MVSLHRMVAEILILFLFHLSKNLLCFVYESLEFQILIFQTVLIILLDEFLETRRPGSLIAHGYEE